jgi:hypothetical protein
MNTGIIMQEMENNKNHDFVFVHNSAFAKLNFNILCQKIVGFRISYTVFYHPLIKK